MEVYLFKIALFTFGLLNRIYAEGGEPVIFLNSAVKDVTLQKPTAALVANTLSP